MEKIKEIFWFWRWLEEEHPVAYEIVMTAEIFISLAAIVIALIGMMI